MENVWVVEEIWEYDGQVDTDVKVYKTYENAKKRFEELKDNNNTFIEDVQEDVDNGNMDSIIDNDENYFYAYDSFNFDALTITIEKMEVL